MPANAGASLFSRVNDGSRVRCRIDSVGVRILPSLQWAVDASGAHAHFRRRLDGAQEWR